MAEETQDFGTSEETDQTSDPYAGTPLEGSFDEDTEFETEDEAADEEGATSDDEALIPFDQLPPELRPHQARMTKAYQEKMKGIREQQQKIDAFDRFMNDADYQRQFLQNAARQLGMELRPAGNSTNGQQATQGRESASSDVQRLAEEALADQPDLQFLAGPIAKIAERIANATVESRISPYEAEQKQARAHQQEAEFDQMVEQLSESAPGWETYEDEMANLWQFFERASKGGPRMHPKYGNVLSMMHRLVTGDAQAEARAGRRMRTALGARDTTSTGRQATRPNVRDLIDKAPDDDDKWNIAFNDAFRRHRR